nr:hypothetical protein [Acinetobacter sp. Marseille-Q1620]
MTFKSYHRRIFHLKNITLIIKCISAFSLTLLIYQLIFYFIIAEKTNDIGNAFATTLGAFATTTATIVAILIMNNWQSQHNFNVYSKMALEILNKKSDLYSAYKNILRKLVEPTEKIDKFERDTLIAQFEESFNYFYDKAEFFAILTGNKFLHDELLNLLSTYQKVYEKIHIGNDEEILEIGYIFNGKFLSLLNEYIEF